MPTSHSDTERFSLLVDALRPWLGKVVFIGGWAHRLYRERPEAGAPPYDALRTEDADIALVPGTIARTEDLCGRLIARGFYEEMSGDDQPPVTHYSLGREELGFYAEFLTPLQGSERRLAQRHRAHRRGRGAETPAPRRSPDRRVGNHRESGQRLRCTGSGRGSRP
jgi:hypothetical protein